MQQFTPYIEETKERFKKAPFWKCAAFGLACMFQEYEIYEKIAKDRAFDMSKFLKKTMERFWKAVATGYSMDEKYILAIEESFFEPKNEWEQLALQIIEDFSDFFYGVYEKKTEKVLEMQERQLKLLEKYFSLLGENMSVESDLIKKVFSYHEQWAMEISMVANKDKKKFLEEFQTREFTGLFGDEFEKQLPKEPKEKPAKKKLPEIRVTSLDFDRDSKNRHYQWLLRANPEQWVTENDREQGGAFVTYYKEKHYAALCFSMKIKYIIYAHEDYVTNRMPERVRGFWYLAALTTLRGYQLMEKGYPKKLPQNQIYELENFSEGRLSNAIYMAYASGEDKLIPELLHFSKEQRETKDLADLFGNIDSDDLYHRIEEWEDGEIKAALLAILAKDVKEFRKAILKRIRHTRKQYDQYRIMVDVCAYACMRLVKERHLEVEPIIVAELLDGNMEFTSLEQEWKLPYHEEIEAFLR